MSLAYSLLYAVGYTPWEEIAELPLVNQQFSALLEREEHDRRPPFGRRARPRLRQRHLDASRSRARLAGHRRRHRLQGAAPRPRPRPQRRRRRAPGPRPTSPACTPPIVGTGFRLLLDFGLFHDELTDPQRAAMGRAVTAVAAPGATLLMMAWAPEAPQAAAPRRRPRRHPSRLPRLDDPRRAPFDVSDAPFYQRVTDADPRFYRLTPGSAHRDRGTRTRPTTPPTSQQISSAVDSVALSTGVTLPYVTQGDTSGVPVLLLHGYADSWRFFEPLLAHLPQSVHAYAPTQRGHGDADRPRAGYRQDGLRRRRRGVHGRRRTHKPP